MHKDCAHTCHAPQSQSFSRSYGSSLPTSLTYMCHGPQRRQTFETSCGYGYGFNPSPNTENTVSCVLGPNNVLPQRLFKGLGQRYSTLWRKYLARRQYPYATWSAYKIPALSGRVDISPIARPRQSVGRDPIQGPLVVQGPGSSQGTKFPIPFRHKRGEGLRVLTTSSSSSSVSVPLCVTLHNTTRIIATLYH